MRTSPSWTVSSPSLAAAAVDGQASAEAVSSLAELALLAEQVAPLEAMAAGGYDLYLQIDEIRGVDSSSALKLLLEKHLVKVLGKSEEVGRPLLYGTTKEFLELFASLETKAAMIVTFLALLELVRLKRVRVYQRGRFGAIRVFRPVGPPAEGTPVPST